MIYATVCSGIDAPAVAWKPLGWTQAFSSDIEPFPNAVRAHHDPDVPNYGDMTKFREWPDHDLGLICAGTPCQAFSVAGLRKGLDDPRGNLTLVFLGILDRYRPEWVVWENVHGVLSIDGGRVFGTFLGGLGNLGYGFAYRVLDAQYFGVPQRRRRVFVVGHLGDWRRAAAVLFERHSLQGHPAPRREAGQSVANCLTDRADRGGTNSEGQRLIPQVANPLTARMGKGVNTTADEGNTPIVTHSLRAEGFDASKDGTGRGTPLVPVGVTLHGTDGTQSVASLTDVSSSLRARIPSGVENSTTTAVLHPMAFDTTQITSAANYSNPKAGDPCHPLAAGMHPPALAWTTKLHNTASNNAGKIFEERATCLDANSPPPALLTAMQVRRLTPRECERLQGFPDDYTLITVRGKPAADGSRYKALGNSMAVPCMRWLGERVQMVEELVP